jgi:actin-like ATPase involved in cell morphogenesis
MLSHDMAIDLGTANTLVYVKDRRQKRPGVTQAYREATADCAADARGYNFPPKIWMGHQ